MGIKTRFGEIPEHGIVSFGFGDVWQMDGEIVYADMVDAHYFGTVRDFEEWALGMADEVDYDWAEEREVPFSLEIKPYVPEPPMKPMNDGYKQIDKTPGQSV